jgi:ureidoacrylate peracid hydrolase
LAVQERINRVAVACRAAGILVIHTSHVVRTDASNVGVLGEIAPIVKQGSINKGSSSAALHKKLLVDTRRETFSWKNRASARFTEPTWN